MPTDDEIRLLNQAPTQTAEIAPGYDALLRDIKTRVRTAQIRAAQSVNSELVLLYWGICRDILQRQQEQGWGTKVIEQLAADLKRNIPNMTGLSLRNLKYMTAFAEPWSSNTIMQAPLA